MSHQLGQLGLLLEMGRGMGSVQYLNGLNCQWEHVSDHVVAPLRFSRLYYLSASLCCTERE